MAFTARPADILTRAAALQPLAGSELTDRAVALGRRARSGIPLKSLLADTYPLAIEATRRITGKRLYPVQVQGAVAMFHGRIAEMQTGEGKTITGVLPAALFALAGRGVHVFTANEYLATRDAEQLRPIFALLGLTSAAIKHDLEDAERKVAYSRDITYGTANEIGFDFLRDRIKREPDAEEGVPKSLFSNSDVAETTVQRGLYCAIVDEADSVLIDDARTPLIIGIQRPISPSHESLYRWARRIVTTLDAGRDFVLDAKRRHAVLTDEGCRQVMLAAKPLALDPWGDEEIIEHVERSLAARLTYRSGREYVVRPDDTVAIVDEGTGRVMEGRQWQEGLHQAIEAQEEVGFSPITRSAARITIQTLFRRYEVLCGMTGTAWLSRRELRKVYRTAVTVVPTHRPCRRAFLPIRVFATQVAKRTAIVNDVRQRVTRGQPVLIGTPSVTASEALSTALAAAGVEHEVLNCHRHEVEAAIVSQAGQQGRVTVATNMAGRGTDILLDELVRQAGGLHVILTERHSSRRIDRQLVGRAARQGDPGSCQYFLSFEDELLTVLNGQNRERLGRRACRHADAIGELSATWDRILRRLQLQLERLHITQRRRLLKRERELLKRMHSMGLDPFLELVEE